MDLFDSSKGQLIILTIMSVVLFTAVIINVVLGGQASIFDLNTKINYMMNNTKSNDY